jgi:acetyl-CoA synthetase
VLHACGFSARRCVRDFTWERARDALDGLPAGRGLNMPTKRSTARCGPLAGKVALRWLGRRGERAELT